MVDLECASLAGLQFDTTQVNPNQPFFRVQMLSPYVIFPMEEWVWYAGILPKTTQTSLVSVKIF